MQEPVVAARADDQAFRQILAQPLDRGFADSEHEGRLLQQAALAGLPDQRVEIAAPGGGENDIRPQRQQARNFGGIVRRAELREKLRHHLHVGLHRLQCGGEDLPAFAAPRVVLIDDRDGLEVGLGLEQIDQHRQHLGRAVGLGAEIVAILLGLEDRGCAAIPHEVHDLEVFGDRDKLVAAARGDRGEGRIDLFILHHAPVIRDQRFAAGAFIDEGEFYGYAADAALLVEIFRDHLGRGLCRHAEHGSRSRKKCRDTNLDFLGLALSKRCASKRRDGNTGCKRSLETIH